MMSNKGSAKVVYLVILGVVATLCIFIGMIIHSSGTKLILGPGISLNFDKVILKSKGASEQLKFEGFDKISMDIAIGDIEIRQGDDYGVEIEYNGVMEPDVGLRDNVLEITQQSIKLGINLRPDMKCRIKITIPKDALLESVIINDALGDVEIKEVDTKVLEISADLGDVKINDARIEKIDIDSALGNVELRDMKAVAADIDAAMGDIRFEGSFDTLEADAAMGDIRVENSNTDSDVHFDLECALGDIRYNGEEYSRSYSR